MEKGLLSGKKHCLLEQVNIKKEYILKAGKAWQAEMVFFAWQA